MTQAATKGVRWPIRCAECGKGNVVPKAAPGRTARYKTLAEVPVPDDLEIPTCDACGMEWIDRTSAKAIDAALETTYQQQLRQLASAHLRHLTKQHITQQRLERILGLSQGYLSKIRSGTSNPSPMLVSILGLLKVDPEKRLQEMEMASVTA